MFGRKALQFKELATSRVPLFVLVSLGERRVMLSFELLVPFSSIERDLRSQSDVRAWTYTYSITVQLLELVFFHSSARPL